MTIGAEAVRYDPYSEAMRRDPYPTYRQMRDRAPAYHDEERDFWALSRFDDVLNGLHDPPASSSPSSRTTGRSTSCHLSACPFP